MESEGMRGGAPRKNTEDGVGSVRVSLTLMREGKAVVGNITRSFTKTNARVSDVYEAMLRNEQGPR